MKFEWMDSHKHYRCTSDKPVRIKLLEFGGGVYDTRITDMGYVIPRRDGRFMAYVYGSVHPDAPGRFFSNIEEAKRYVEEQALLGITLNKLTR